VWRGGVILTSVEMSILTPGPTSRSSGMSAVLHPPCQIIQRNLKLKRRYTCTNVCTSLLKIADKFQNVDKSGATEQLARSKKS
jgi:hypothetical protein